MANNILAKMSVLISANTAAFDKNLKQSEVAFGKFTKTLSTAGNAIGIAFGGVAAFQGLQYGIGIITDFEARMSEVRAITQASDKEFKSLRDSALDLGKATKFSAEEVAGLQVEFGKLGFSTQEILNSTKATLELATATGEDLAGSAEIAGSTLRSFNLDATDMQRVVDVMAASFNKSALGLSNFGEAIKYVAPVAAAANISLEETTALLGVLADNGIRGSMAGTSLRKIISDVKNETGTLAERLAKMAEKGLSGADAMDEVGRTAYASLLILTKNVDKVNEATEAYKNSSGEAKKMADIMGDNLSGDVAKLNSAFEAMILSGSGVSVSLREVVQAITDLINLLNTGGFAEGVVNGLEAIIRQGMLIPTVVKAIRDYNAANKEVAITAEENQKIIDEVWGKPQEIDQTTQAINRQAEAVQKLARSATSLPKSAGTTKPVSIDGNKTGSDFLSDMDFNSTASQVETATNRISTAMINSEMSIESWGESMRINADLMEEKMIELGPMVAGAVSSMADAIGRAFVNSQGFGQSILAAVAGFARQLGEAMIAIGTSMLVAKAMIKNPYTAIAAGIALVALAGAMSASMSGAQSNFNASGSGGSGVSSSSSASSSNISNLPLNKVQQIELGGVIEVAGDKLLVIIRNAEAKEKIRRG